MRRLQLFFLFLIGTHISIQAQSGGKAVYEFLSIPMSARVGSLGGAIPAFKDKDIQLAISNPSLINAGISDQLSLNYLSYFADIKSGYAGYSKSFDKAGSFLLGIQFLDYGKFIAADPNSEITGAFTAADYSFNLGWAKPIDSNFYFGSAIKTIYSHLEQYTSVALASDISGTYFIPKQNIGFSMILSNIGFQTKTYNGSKLDLPFNAQIVVSKKLKHAPLQFTIMGDNLNNYRLTYKDPSKPKVNSLTGELIEEKSQFVDNLFRHFIFGVEILPTKNIQLRLAYNHKRREEMKAEARSGITGLSFGLGLKFSRFNINYSRAVYHLSGASNQLSLATDFSNFLH